MKLLSRHAIVALLGATTMASQAAVIDDFSDTSLSEWTSTVILDANGGGSNTATWESPSGALQLNTSTYDGIQQYAMIYNGLSLAIGEELQVTRTLSGGNQDLGLYVGGTTPATGVRADYVAVYGRDNGQVYSRGFDGTSEYGLVGGSSPTYDSLFIARTAANTYEAGYYDGATRTILTTRTPATANDADVIGIYADVRGAGTLGTLDNFRVVPEPSVALLGGLGLLGLMRRRRA
jgi:hypothetical protein